MELMWNKPDCENCKNNSRYFKNFHTGQKLAVRCDARQQAMPLNGSFKRLNNCWYFEHK